MSSSALKTSQETSSTDQKPNGDASLQQLDTVEELNENVPSEIFEQPFEDTSFVEIPAKIFGLKNIREPLTIPSLNNAIYELGVVNLCWPEINEPVFETRTCFPPSYYTNSKKERLLLAYAENFRRQFNFHYRMRKPILLQVPNECGLQKMVCTSIRPTRLCYRNTNTWQGVASLVADYFDYEPLTKSILHDDGAEPVRAAALRSYLARRVGSGYTLQRDPTRSGQFYIELRVYNSKEAETLAANRWKRALFTLRSSHDDRGPPERLMSPYTAIVRRSANPFELAHVLVSWLIGSGYDAYVVVGCATRDVCMGIRYRTECPEIPDETEKVEVPKPPDEEPRYQLVPLPDLTSKYVIEMEIKEAERMQREYDKSQRERRRKIAELEMPPKDDIDGWRTHAWILVLPPFMGVEEPFFIEPSEGNGYPLDAKQYQHIDSVYNNENYYVNIQSLEKMAKPKKSKKKKVEEVQENAEGQTEGGSKANLQTKGKSQQNIQKKEEQKSQMAVQSQANVGSQMNVGDKEEGGSKLNVQNKAAAGSKTKVRSQAAIDKSAEGENQEDAQEDDEVCQEKLPKPKGERLAALSYELSDILCWEHLLPGEPTYRRHIIGVDVADKKTALDTEKHLDMPGSWVEKLDISVEEFEQRYPGSYKVIHYKKVLVEKFSAYSQSTGIIKRIKIFSDHAISDLLTEFEWYRQREDKMNYVKIDHVARRIKETFGIGRKDHLLKHEYSMDAPVTSVEGDRVMEFNYYPRIDHLTKLVCNPLLLEEHYTDRPDRLEARIIIYTPGTKAEPKRQLKDITEVFRRDPSKPSKKDIWKKIFHIQDNTIDLLYQYDYNFVTCNTRNFIKSNLAETGGKILFYPEKTSGYIADPIAEQPRPLDVYYALCESLEREYGTCKHIRDLETDINTYLRTRHHELTEPQLVIHLYDSERNEAAKEGWIKQELKKAEVSEREKEAEIDPLAPYLARMFGSGHGPEAQMTLKEATLIREQCINDFKTKQLTRQHLVQTRFDKYNTEYKNKRLWYLANQYVLTPEKEGAYFALSAELSFKVHALEVRLTRHRDLSGPRFKILMDYLEKHPLLTEYNRLARLHHHQERSREKSDSKLGLR